MLYWESKRRLESLREFRDLVLEYFSNAKSKYVAGAPLENEKAHQTRTEINRRVGMVLKSCQLGGESLTVYYTPPPLTGGVATPINLLLEMFELWRYPIPKERITDSLDRAIGNYERRTEWLRKQLFNPLFWLQWSTSKILSTPFRLLGLAGFDAKRIEESVFGKLFKAVTALAGFVYLVLQILDKLGLLELLKAAIGLPT